MITGWVNSAIEMIVPLPIFDANHNTHKIEFVVDSGFSNSLALPVWQILQLGLTWDRDTQVELGDGVMVQVPRHLVTVLWDGNPQHLFVLGIGSVPLLGTRLLQGHDLRARMEDGGIVEIEAIP